MCLAHAIIEEIDQLKTSHYLRHSERRNVERSKISHESRSQEYLEREQEPGYLEGSDDPDRRLEETAHVVQPLGPVYRLEGGRGGGQVSQEARSGTLQEDREPHLEPRRLVRRRLTEGAEGLEALPDAMDVGQVHEEDLGVGVVPGQGTGVGASIQWEAGQEALLRTLHAAPPGPVAHRCGVAPGVDDEHLLDLPQAGGGLGRVLGQAGRAGSPRPRDP